MGRVSQGRRLPPVGASIASHGRFGAVAIFFVFGLSFAARAAPALGPNADRELMSRSLKGSGLDAGDDGELSPQAVQALEPVNKKIARKSNSRGGTGTESKGVRHRSLLRRFGDSHNDDDNSDDNSDGGGGFYEPTAEDINAAAAAELNQGETVTVSNPEGESVQYDVPLDELPGDVGEGEIVPNRGLLSSIYAGSLRTLQGRGCCYDDGDDYYQERRYKFYRYRRYRRPYYSTSVGRTYGNSCYSCRSYGGGDSYGSYGYYSGRSY